MKYLYPTLFLILISGCTISKFDAGYIIPAAQKTDELSFETVQNIIIIEAEINGVSGRFLLDNGFSLSGINQDFAQKAGVTFDGSTSIRDANNKSSTARETFIDTVNIQGHKFVNTGFYEINTQAFLPCTELDGIIGASIINKVNWKIDFKDQKIWLSATPFQAKGRVIDLDYSMNNSAFIDFEIKGKKIRNKIDFGSFGGVKIDRDEFASLFLNDQMEKRLGIASLSANGLGSVDSIYITAEELEIGYDHSPLPVKDKIRLSGNLKYDGYVGIDYFNDYLVFLNSTEKQMILSEVENDRIDQESDKSYSIAIYPMEETWKIIQINPNDPSLDESYLMSEVDLLDGQPMNRFKNICEYRAYLKQKRDQKEPLHILLKNMSDTLKVFYKEPALGVWK